MKKNDFAKVVSAGWVFYILGLTVESVGKQFDGGAYSYSLPISAIVTFGLTWILGYLSGRDGDSK